MDPYVLDDVNEKENYLIANPMQNHNAQGSFQPSMHPQYGNILHPNNNQYGYSQYASNQNVNSYFDELCHEQTPFHPQNTCLTPTYYQQQQLQQQPNSFNPYPNDYVMNSTMNTTHNMNMFGNDCKVNAYGGQCMNPAANYPMDPSSNCMPLTYNVNNNMTINRIDHSMNGARPMDITSQPNASNLPDSARNDTNDFGAGKFPSELLEISTHDFSNVDKLANSSTRTTDMGELETLTESVEKITLDI